MEAEFYRYISLGLLAVVAFFLKAVYSKFMSLTDSISNLNINVEKLLIKYDHSYELIKRNEQQIESLWVEINGLREFRHKHIDDYHNMIEILKDKKDK